MQSNELELNKSIFDEIHRRRITRLCHFTRISSLRHIGEAEGLLSTSALYETKRTFYPTDSERYDGHPTHICCSIQYPNLRYLKRLIESGAATTPHWAILLLDPELLARVDTGFCPVNASERSGARVSSGLEAFQSMFAQRVHSFARSGTKEFKRSDRHLPSCPTTIQAEVLIAERIPSNSITGVVVSSPAALPIAAAMLDSDTSRGVPVQSDPRLFNCNQIEQRIYRGEEIPLATREIGDPNG